MLLTQMGLERRVIDGLVEERDRARLEKNWAESDRIRNDLTAKGIALQDSPEGTLWEVSK
jgi:cysteinyl-tRNA synthetase